MKIMNEAITDLSLNESRNAYAFQMLFRLYIFLPL